MILIATAGRSSSDADTTGRDDDGAVIEDGQIGVFRFREGDCVRLPPSVRDARSEAEDITEVADLEEFPGDADSITQGNPPCIAALDAYTGTEFESSMYSVVPLVPTSDSWDALDDRGLICIGVTLNDELNGLIDTTGSFRAVG